MNKIAENFHEWAEELRQTNRKQCTGTLRDWRGASCCLGIACDIWDRKAVEIPGQYGLPPTYGSFLDETGDSPVIEKLGGASDPFLPIAETTATKCNDSYNLSFEQIAYLADVEAAKLLKLPVDDSRVEEKKD